jgi:hypothetical protein
MEDIAGSMKRGEQNASGEDRSDISQSARQYGKQAPAKHRFLKHWSEKETENKKVHRRNGWHQVTS